MRLGLEGSCGSDQKLVDRDSVIPAFWQDHSSKYWLDGAGNGQMLECNERNVELLSLGHGRRDEEKVQI